MIAIRQRQHGQSLIEFLIAMFAFGFLLLGLFQAILFYRAKATVDYAAMEAARSGAVHGATMSSMREGMARGLTPLLAIASGDPGKASTLLAFEKAKLVTVPLHAAIKVISPTTSAYSDFKEDQGDGTMALPNDSLNYRSSSPGANGMSIQDANILKIQVTYHYPMIVPIVDRVVGAILGGGPDLAYSAEDGHTVYSIPIVSSAEVRMQSPISDTSSLPAN